MSQPVASGEKSNPLWSELHRLIVWGKAALGIATVLVMVLFLGEVARIYQTAAAMHPWLGYASLVLLLVPAGLVVVPIVKFFQMPRVVQPPALPPPEAMTIADMEKECRYLDRYLANATRNPELAEKAMAIADARAELARLRQRVSTASSADTAAVGKEIHAWTDKHVDAILKDLDHRADRLIYQEALTVGLATAASPNGTLDAFVMLWRSVKLVSQLSQMYYGRPGLLGTLAVCRDVSVATALAGYMQNVTESLGGLVAKSVGGVTGVVAGPAVDGVTNALVLIRIGYLAQERCRSFRRWDKAMRGSALRRALAQTQRVAFGLTAEIVRQIGSGLSSVAGAVAGGVVQAAGAAAANLGSMAESAAHRARHAASGIKQTFGSYFRGQSPDSGAETPTST